MSVKTLMGRLDRQAPSKLLHEAVSPDDLHLRANKVCHEVEKFLMGDLRLYRQRSMHPTQNSIQAAVRAHGARSMITIEGDFDGILDYAKLRKDPANWLPSGNRLTPAGHNAYMSAVYKITKLLRDHLDDVLNVKSASLRGNNPHLREVDADTVNVSVDVYFESDSWDDIKGERPERPQASSATTDERFKGKLPVKAVIGRLTEARRQLVDASSAADYPPSRTLVDNIATAFHQRMGGLGFILSGPHAYGFQTDNVFFKSSRRRQGTALLVSCYAGFLDYAKIDVKNPDHVSLSGKLTPRGTKLAMTANGSLQRDLSVFAAREPYPWFKEIRSMEFTDLSWMVNAPDTIEVEILLSFKDSAPTPERPTGSHASVDEALNEAGHVTSAQDERFGFFDRAATIARGFHELMLSFGFGTLDSMGVDAGSLSKAYTRAGKAVPGDWIPVALTGMYDGFLTYAKLDPKINPDRWLNPSSANSSSPASALSYAGKEDARHSLKFLNTQVEKHAKQYNVTGETAVVSFSADLKGGIGFVHLRIVVKMRPVASTSLTPPERPTGSHATVDEARLDEMVHDIDAVRKVLGFLAHDYKCGMGWHEYVGGRRAAVFTPGPGEDKSTWSTTVSAVLSSAIEYLLTKEVAPGVIGEWDIQHQPSGPRMVLTLVSPEAVKPERPHGSHATTHESRKPS